MDHLEQQYNATESEKRKLRAIMNGQPYVVLEPEIGFHKYINVALIAIGLAAMLISYVHSEM